MMHAASEGTDAPLLPAEKAQPLLWCTDAQLAALAKELEAALAGWQRAWGLAPDAAPVRCQPATGLVAPQGSWLPLAGSTSAAAWLGLPAGLEEPIARAMFSKPSAPGGLGASLAAACVRDALVRLASVLALDLQDSESRAPPESATARWSGAVEATLPALPGGVIVLRGTTMQAWCRARKLFATAARSKAPMAPLCAAGDAIAGKSMALRVRLEGCEIELGSLQGLQVGDVVRLRHRLDAPAALEDPRGKPVFAGYLGSHLGRRAVELVPLTHSVQSPSQSEQ